MLDARQARFVETYFQSLNTTLAGASLGMSSVESRAMIGEPVVSEAVSAVMQVLLDDIAAYGQHIYSLPKQAINRQFVVKVIDRGQ